MANIVLTDDHILLRSGLATLIKNLGHKVLFEADNGRHFIQQLNADNMPDGLATVLEPSSLAFSITG